MLYIGISRYTKVNIEKLISLKPEGVIIGDLLCNRKMFPYGGAELTDIIKLFKEENISVVYQTPMYATDRIFSEVLQKVTYLYNEGMIDATIVQDVGLASAIKGKCKELTIIWGRMGYARTPTINKNTIHFYLRHGINAFECKNATQAEYVSSIGAAPYLIYGYPNYLTINRECYYRFEYNNFDEECGEGCLSRKRLLISTGNGIETTIDGYVIGWEFLYDENIIKFAQNNHCIIYVNSPDEAETRISEIRNYR